jgi:hypothetical protein
MSNKQVATALNLVLFLAVFVVVFMGAMAALAWISQNVK